MQRIHIISAAAVVAIVAILLVGRGSKTTWREGEPQDGSGMADGAGRASASLEPAEDGGLPAGSARFGRRAGAVASGGGPGSPAGADERGRASGPGRPGHASAMIAGGKQAGGKGVLGEAVGRRAAGGASAGSSVSMGSGPGSEPGTAAGGRDRSRVMEFLAEPAKGGGDAAKPEDGGDGNSDVVLSVPLTKDTGVAAADATAPVAEQDLKFADDGVGVHFEPGSVLAFPDAGNIKGDAGSLQLDVQPEWSGGDGGDFALVNVRTPNDPSNLLRLFKNGRYLRFLFADSSGQERDISVPIDDWQPGEQRRITATWGDGTTNLYLDGQLAGHNTYDNPLEVRAGTPLYLGSDVPQAPASGANATISNFQVFGRALQGDEIATR